MRVALTGASGFIGAALARHLKDHGHLVTGLLRKTSRRDHVEGSLDRIVVGTQQSAVDRAALLEDADALIHNSFDWQAHKGDSIERHIEINLTSSLLLFYAAAEKKIPVVFISSVAVHQHMLDRWEGTIDEAHPTRPGGLYGAVKASLEAHLWALKTSHDLEFTILRPSAVYGIDPRLERSVGYPIVKAIAEDRGYQRPGGGKFVHVDDVAACTVAAIERPLPTVRIHHLADCYARWGDWATMVAQLLNVDAQINLESPDAPRNMFSRTSVQRDFGVNMDRGLDGIRDYLIQLIAHMPDVVPAGTSARIPTDT